MSSVPVADEKLSQLRVGSITAKLSSWQGHARLRDILPHFSFRPEFGIGGLGQRCRKILQNLVNPGPSPDPHPHTGSPNPHALRDRASDRTCVEWPHRKMRTDGTAHEKTRQPPMTVDCRAFEVHSMSSLAAAPDGEDGLVAHDRNSPPHAIGTDGVWSPGPVTISLVRRCGCPASRRSNPIRRVRAVALHLRRPMTRRRPR